MIRSLNRHVLILLGWVCVVLGLIGIPLPLLPTTPFLILALALFARSSPRFHRMLLDNPHVGPGLRQWEQSRTVTRKTKRRAQIVVVLSFGVSLFVLQGRPGLQLMLLALGLVSLYFMGRLKEAPAVAGPE